MTLTLIGIPIVETDAFMTDHMLGIEFAAQGILPPDVHGLDFQDTPRDETSLANGARFRLPQRAPTPGEYPRQWTVEASKEMGPEWRHLWDQTRGELEKELLSLEGSSVLGYLFSRIGHDCGVFLRALHKMNISWGTYQDEMCFDGQWHCNAHANNMVVLAEGSHPSMLLGYLDLDMAFDSETFVDTWGTGKIGMKEEIFLRSLS